MIVERVMSPVKARTLGTTFTYLLRRRHKSITEPSFLRATTLAYIVAHLPWSTLQQAHVQQVWNRCNNFVHEP